MSRNRAIRWVAAASLLGLLGLSLEQLRAADLVEWRQPVAGNGLWLTSENWWNTNTAA
jgi:hypothetical protein